MRLRVDVLGFRLFEVSVGRDAPRERVRVIETAGRDESEGGLQEYVVSDTQIGFHPNHPEDRR